MLQELSKAFLLVFSAEMGDKSQLLALAFATRYPVKKVLSGMFLGILINHSLAVFVGSLFSRWLDPVFIQWLAGLAFVAFALWSLKAEEAREEEERLSSKESIVLTIALAFFIGELGDKTQLTAITLAAQTTYPLIILSGTMSAMLLTGMIGIFLGKKLGKQVPELYIKLLAALIFAFFGWMKLYPVLGGSLRIGFMIIFALAFLGLSYRRVQFERSGGITAFAQRAEELRQFYDSLSEELEQTCLHCPSCEEGKCYVGYTKQIIKGEPVTFALSPAGESKRFDSMKLERMRIRTRRTKEAYPEEKRLSDILEKLEQMAGK